MRRQNVSPSLPVVEEARPVDAVEQLDIESVGETPAEADGGESAEERMALYARVARQAREEGMREAYPDFDPDDALDDPVLGPLGGHRDNSVAFKRRITHDLEHHVLGDKDRADVIFDLAFHGCVYLLAPCSLCQGQSPAMA